jgi:hypothetical protein
MDCGTPPGGAAAAVGESVEWEEEAAETVRRGGREAMAAAYVRRWWGLGERRHGDRDLEAGKRRQPRPREESLAVRSVVWSGGRKEKGRTEGGNDRM